VKVRHHAGFCPLLEGLHQKGFETFFDAGFSFVWNKNSISVFTNIRLYRQF